MQQLLPGADPRFALALFSLLFFGAVLFFSLRPGELLTWIGKVLNPLFLCFLAVLVVRALTAPLGEVSAAAPVGAYAVNAFGTGFLEGYNTMDALAGLAFGIVVVDAIRRLGVTEPAEIARSTVGAGVFSALLMALIYLLVAVMAAQSRGLFEPAANGGEALAQIARHYFGGAGALFLALTVTVACLKTAVGLVTSCGETFVQMFPRGPGYPVWAVGFCAFSFVIANFGLNAIIAWAAPVLMFLYPLAIVLILLTLCGGLFGHSRRVLGWTVGCTVPAAALDLICALPKGSAAARLLAPVAGLARWLPLADSGFGWVLPALAGLAVGLVLTRRAGARG